MNKVIMTGRNTKDLELKQLTSGTSVIEFSIAVKRPFKNDESDFINCVAFSKTAETISRYVKKGDLIGIEGRLQTRSYTNKEGRTINVTEIIVENVEFLQPKKQEEPKQAEQWEELDPFSNDLPFNV